MNRKFNKGLGPSFAARGAELVLRECAAKVSGMYERSAHSRWDESYPALDEPVWDLQDAIDNFWEVTGERK